MFIELGEFGYSFSILGNLNEFKMNFDRTSFAFTGTSDFKEFKDAESFDPSLYNFLSEKLDPFLVSIFLKAVKDVFLSICI